jgi:cytosine/adenosine deaminase-related metal-dependent hydrolase
MYFAPTNIISLKPLSQKPVYFMIYIAGQIYQSGEFIQGYMGIENGTIAEFGEGNPQKADFRGIILPTLVNAHTHIADSVAFREIKGDIAEVVAPPDGLKHRILKETPPEILIKAMKKVSFDMMHSGIGYFGDFREGGIEGVKQLSQAISNPNIKAKVFGRPKDLVYDEAEMEELLSLVDGIGLSAISDYDKDEIIRISQHTKSKGKMFALHASERIREDIDAILDLKPDFLIHMNCAEESDLKLCAENEVPIILCPRSEVFFRNVPDITKMHKCGVTLALGTDNAMLNSPSSILREMEFAYKIARLSGGVDSKEILDMVLKNSRKVLNVSDDIRFTLGMKANLVVFDLAHEDPAYSIVNGAHPKNLSAISMEDFLWMENRSQ